MSASILLNVQILAAVLFAIGLAIVIAKRNVFFLLMGIEILLNAINLSYIGFARSFPAQSGIEGQVVPLFVIALAAAEACIGLAMVIALVRQTDSLDSETYAVMEE